MTIDAAPDARTSPARTIALAQLAQTEISKAIGPLEKARDYIERIPGTPADDLVAFSLGDLRLADSMLTRLISAVA